MITSSDFPTLTLKLNEWFNEAAAMSVQEWKGQQLFDCGATDWQVYNGLILNGAAKFARVAEGAQLPLGSIVEGDGMNITQKRYGGRLSVTKDMRMFDRYDQIQEVVQDNANFAINQIDQLQADLLLNGFSGSSYTDIMGDTQSNLAADAVVLFSASHTNNQNANTARNLIRVVDGAGTSTSNPGLSRAAIVYARKDAKVYKDPNNANRPINLNKLIVPATQEDLAERTVYSSGVVGTPNVDLNPLKGKVSNILVWSRLDTRQNDNTDTSNYWFLADESIVKKTLKCPFAQRPTMYAPNQIDDSKNWEYTIDAYFTMGALYPFGIWGSTGVN